MQVWADAKEQAERDRADRHFEKLYTDDKYFEQLANNPQMQRAARLSVAPDLLEYESANRAYFDYIAGRQLTEEEYQSKRLGYLKTHFGKASAGDGELYRMIRSEYEAKKIRRGVLISTDSERTSE